MKSDNDKYFFPKRRGQAVKSLLFGRSIKN